MINVSNGYMKNYQNHHKGWFRVFRFENRMIEIWFGHRYWNVWL